MITTKVAEGEVLARFNQVMARLDDMTPAMQDIGEYLVDSTKRRFAAGVSPDGVPWAPNSQVTYEMYFDAFARTRDKTTGKRGAYKKGYLNKQGRVTQRGAGLLIGKKPLIGETKRLSHEIYYNASRTGVEVGSPLAYAAVDQFGAKKHSFTGGKTPWGDIPARAFLGLSGTDRTQVLDILSDYLAAAPK